MHGAFALAVVLATLGSAAELAPRGWLVVDAVAVEADAPQPRWFYVCRGFACTHVPANARVVPLRPGRYRLSHLDFTATVLGDERTVFIPSEKPFDIAAGGIYVLGRFEVGHRIGRRTQVDLVVDGRLIADACRSRPDVFATLPVRAPAADGTLTREVMLQCPRAATSP